MDGAAEGLSIHASAPVQDQADPRKDLFGGGDVPSVSDQPAKRLRVAHAMRELNIRGRQYRCKVVTTRSGRRWHGIPEGVDRQFHPERPNKLWVSDAIWLPTREGSLFLAVILDACCTRRVLGWQMSKVQGTSLMFGALKMAVRGRNPRGVILHSDQGCQYASKAYQSRCVEYGVRQSMGSAGDCYDNAMVESWFATLKREGLPMGCYLTPEETRIRVIDTIEGRYNTFSDLPSFAISISDT